MHYLLGTLFGIIPASFIYVYTAASLMQVYMAGAELDDIARAALRTSALTNLGIAFTLLVVISMVPVVYRKLRRKA